MMIHKKGQGLSLTTIIVAALALIVLVVLVLIFTGRIALFEQGVSDSGNSELVQMQVGYGQCEPTTSAGSTFKTSFGSAETDAEKDEARAVLRDEISRCKTWNSEKEGCQENGCVWG
ncbi:TPA: hypothetical protein HA278_06480 [Candidatus Woesearchaeota archaeon]|nr:hypothetical protein [Candidatus Woesearchaeota archaeon]|tara:strand:- start:176 stop:526 length:351 start_codon:yes stop_codon:yes gene_type:complete